MYKLIEQTKTYLSKIEASECTEISILIKDAHTNHLINQPLFAFAYNKSKGLWIQESLWNRYATQTFFLGWAQYEIISFGMFWMGVFEYINHFIRFSSSPHNFQSFPLHDWLGTRDIPDDRYSFSITISEDDRPKFEIWIEDKFHTPK